MGDWYGYKNREGKLEIYDLINNPKQDLDLSSRQPEIAKKIEEIMKREHTPSDVWPSPGESEEEFMKRMIMEGVGKRPKNVADF